MIWHIFKKDVRLLWPMAFAVVCLQSLCAAVTWLLGYFNQPAGLARLTDFLPLLVCLGIALAGVAVVHQEPLEATRSDWLIRPISRGDLVLSKVLFMVLMVNLPLMLVDVVQQLALHFPLSASVGVAASRSLVLLMVFSLPALVLGAVTRSLTDAFVFAIASIIAFYCLTLVAFVALSPGLLGGGSVHGMSWIKVACGCFVMTLGAGVTLAFQYSTRRTFLARCMGLAAVSAALCTFFVLSKGSTIAIQELLWGPSTGSEIALRFDPSRQGAVSERDTPHFYSNPHTTATMDAVIAAEDRWENGRISKVGIPLRISGMHQGDILFADQVAVRVIATSGSVLYGGAGACFRTSNGIGVGCADNTLEVWAAPQGGSDTPSEQRLNLPIAVYERIKNQPVRMEVTYDLTRLARRGSQAIEAAGSVQPLPEMGSCATRIDTDGDEVELWCLTNVGVPSCAAVVLEDPETNTRNPELHLCNPNYAPFHRIGFESAVERSRLRVPFRDPSGLAHYPVSSGAIQRARIVLTAYDSAEHFHRTLLIPSIRLAEWELPNKTPRNSY